MDISAIALQGIQQAEAQLTQAASAIASGGGSDEVVDLSAEMIALMNAQNQTAANLAVLKTSNEVQQNLLDILA